MCEGGDSQAGWSAGQLRSRLPLRAVPPLRGLKEDRSGISKVLTRCVNEMRDGRSCSRQR